MKEIRTEVEIAVSAQKVWQVLTDFSRYPEWNPFIREAKGEAKEGSKIEIRITTPSGARRTYEPRVTKAEPGKELRWLGKVPGFLSGEHIFALEEKNGVTLLVHREVFGGLLTSFFGKSLDEDVRAGFEQMNRALKARAEG
ncbi:SRPBCC family protein [Candidatus Nitrososphaera sp. FF02]|uniref:SRPBCC family protein n=1 Tax=Candidatus Nitrososphaera sp. FF02 TaxID=3398226 RepID=UPI0039E832A0